MERFFLRLHNRRETLKREEMSQRKLWREDDCRVRGEGCEFAVKYLGCREVDESKGIKIIEDAIRSLRFGNQGVTYQPSFFLSRSKSNENLYHCGSLHISGDGLRFVDDATEDVVVDTPIEKISFCGPDRENAKCFGYICREESHWKWICHAFKAVNDHADRLNNAVGCAFTLCLEKRHRAQTENQVTSQAAAKQVTSPIPKQEASTGQPSTAAAATFDSSTVVTTMNTGYLGDVSEEAELHRQDDHPYVVDQFEMAWSAKPPKNALL